MRKKGNTSLLSQPAAQSRHSYPGRVQGIQCAATIPTGVSIPALAFFLYHRDGVRAGLAGPSSPAPRLPNSAKVCFSPRLWPPGFSGTAGDGEHLQAGLGGLRLEAGCGSVFEGLCGLGVPKGPLEPGISLRVCSFSLLEFTVLLI